MFTYDDLLPALQEVADQHAADKLAPVLALAQQWENKGDKTVGVGFITLPAAARALRTAVASDG